jgi:Mce-associated membrane protein
MTDDDAAADAGSNAQDEPGRIQRLVVLVLVAALAIALIAAVMLWRDRQDLMDRAEEAENAQSSAAPAEEAARAAVTRMTTYDFRTVEEDFSWVEDAGTAEFQETFTGAAEDAIKLIKGLKSSAVGTVIDSASTVVDDNRVKVLLFVDQELMAPGQEKPELEESRVTMHMVRQGDQWLVNEVELQNLLGP